MRANSGYVGFSMSVRAFEAYNNGDKPKSKWKKSDIIDILEEVYDEEIIKKIKKYSSATIKKAFLIRSSWHHVSKYFNPIDFYSVNTEIEKDRVLDKLERVNQFIKEEKEVKEKIKNKYVKFTYLMWSGTRKHPKATEIENVGVLRNDSWIYYLECGTLKKKNITTNGVVILEKRTDLRGKTFDNEDKECLRSILKKM